MKSPAAKQAVAAAAVVFLLVACKDSGDASPPASGATVPTLAPTTSTTNPYAVPAVIDAAYVNRVLAGLDAIYGDAFRIMVNTKSLPVDAVDRFKAIYGDRDLLNSQLQIVQDAVRFNLAQVPAIPGNKRTVVSQLLTSRPSCIYASVTRDYSAFSGRTTPERQEWVAIRPLDPASDPNRYNGTGWVLTYEGSASNGQAPNTPPCAAA